MKGSNGWINPESVGKLNDKHVIIIDIMGALLYSKSDKPYATRAITLDEVIPSLPNLPLVIDMMKEDGFLVVGWARKLSVDLQVSLQSGKFGNLDAIITGKDEKFIVLFNKTFTPSTASFHIASPDSELKYFENHNQVYSLRDAIDEMWPDKLDGPSIRESGEADLIVLVGSSGSGRDEAVEYLKGKGYNEVRRITNMKKVITTITRYLEKNERVVFNATNPLIQNRTEILHLHPSGRIWWFARPGRAFAKAKIPESAFTRYSREFEEPTPNTDGVPVIRLT